MPNHTSQQRMANFVSDIINKIDDQHQLQIIPKRHRKPSVTITGRPGQPGHVSVYTAGISGPFFFTELRRSDWLRNLIDFSMERGSRVELVTIGQDEPKAAK